MKIYDLFNVILDLGITYGFDTEVHFAGCKKFHFDLDPREQDYDGNSKLATIPDIQEDDK